MSLTATDQNGDICFYLFDGLFPAYCFISYTWNVLRCAEGFHLVFDQSDISESDYAQRHINVFRSRMDAQCIGIKGDGSYIFPPNLKRMHSAVAFYNDAFIIDDQIFMEL